ncbi:hypothetical protein ACFLW1_02035 [Chloroflexota bacterium]
MAKIVVLLIAAIIITAGALVLPGVFNRAQDTAAGGESGGIMEKPAIDKILPARTEVATFSLG